MIKVAIIDNYDSFTYNLVQYLLELGEEVIVHRNDEISLDRIREADPQQIVISPGPCTPNEAGISVDCIKEFGSSIPILGVCLGHQSIAQAFGGTCECRPVRPGEGVWELWRIWTQCPHVHQG